jgi:hypothetical protein
MMRSPLRLRRLLIASPLFVLPLWAAGCDDTAPRSDGPDMAYLTNPLEEQPDKTPQRPLLPLTKGARWDMVSATIGKKTSDTIVVVGPSTVVGVNGTEVETRRKGKRWRRDFYQYTPQGRLQLTAMQDETSGMIHLIPPLPLANRPAREGDALPWTGTFRMGNVSLPATALSRISAREKVTTPAGRFDTYRIDTSLMVTRSNGDDVRFPSVRWLAPGVGFVRRAFTEKGEAAFSEMTNFSLP